MVGTAAVLALAVAMCCAGQARAADVYVGAGTTGFLAGIEHHYSDAGAVRADISGYSLSRDTSDSSATYHGTAHLFAVGLFADYYPFGTGWRLSAGALVGNTYLDAEAVPTANGTFTINGVPVSAAGQTLSARVKLPSVRPFMGIGWGHVPRDTGMYGLFDLGVAYGRPDVSLDATPGLATAAAQAGTSIEAERLRLQGKANDFRLYPVIRAGLGWGW